MAAFGKDHRTREEALTAALESRTAIGTAIGILMAESGIGREDAFAMLVSASQRENRKLRDVAEAIVLAHEPSASGRTRRDSVTVTRQGGARCRGPAGTAGAG